MEHHGDSVKKDKEVERDQQDADKRTSRKQRGRTFAGRGVETQKGK